MKLWTALVVIVGLTFTASGASPQSDLRDVLAKAAEYHADYRVRVSGTSLDEHYTLAQLMPGRTVMPVRFKSDLVLLNVGGRILALRDPYSVDDVSLRPRTLRILDLLVNPTSETWARAQSYAEEQQFRFLFDLIVTLSDPAVALQFISGEMQTKCTFKLEKRESIDGFPVIRVGFKETRTPGGKQLLGTPGNAEASGRFWIDPTTGGILKTELWATSNLESVVINVTYAKDMALDLWLPTKMSQAYQWKEGDAVLTNRNAGGYDERMSFQGAASYGAVRHTRVDLLKMSR